MRAFLRDKDDRADDGGARPSDRPTLPRASDVQALLEAERLLAQTNRSGVRAMTFGTSKEASPVAVPPAASSPPTIEVTIEVSRTIPLAPPTPRAMVSESPGPGAFPLVRSHIAPPAPSRSSWVPTVPRVVAGDVPSVAPRRNGGGVRRFFAGLLFLILMAGAVALLATALSRRGLLRIPDLHGVGR